MVLLVVANRDMYHVVLEASAALQTLMFCHQDLYLILFIAGGLMLLEREFLMEKVLPDQGS